MNESLKKALTQGLYGKNTHIDPKKAIEGLTATTAKISLENEFHTCWALIHHMVVWMEVILDSIRGKEVDWKKISEESNWPDTKVYEHEGKFEKLVEKFLNGIETAEELLKESNLNEPMPAWANEPILTGFIVLLQHNSYHLGQLIAVRRALNI